MKYIVMTALILLLAGCSTMNTHFSCNATADDSCLSIEAVDDMTKFADDSQPYNQGRLAKIGNGPLWVTKNIRREV